MCKKKIFCDTDVFVDLLMGKENQFNQDINYLKSIIYVSDFTLFEASGHQKKSIMGILTPWLAQNPNFLVRTNGDTHFELTSNSFALNPEQETDLKNDVSGYLSSQFESIILDFSMVCLHSCSYNFLGASAFNKAALDLIKTQISKYDHDFLDLDMCLYEKISSDIQDIISKQQFDHKLLRNLFNIYYCLFMKYVFCFHNNVVSQFSRKNSVSISFIENQYLSAKNVLLLRIKSMNYTTNLATPNMVKNYNYIAALAKANNKNASWAASEKAKMLKQFLFERQRFNSGFDFMRTFDSIVFANLLNGYILSSNTFFDIYNILCFARMKKRKSIYLSCDQAQYRNYINTSKDHIFDVSKKYYPL
jgi:hypothetical protein